MSYEITQDTRSVIGVIYRELRQVNVALTTSLWDSHA